MNDFIDLPHLPECLLGLPLETIHEIHSHTYHAIKADRQQRGEPVDIPPGWKEQFKEAVYENLAAADNQDIPLEEYPERILKVLEAVVGPRHPTVIMWRNDAIRTCVSIAYKYCRDPETHKYLKQDLEALLTTAPQPAAPTPDWTNINPIIVKYFGDDSAGAARAQMAIEEALCTSQPAEPRTEFDDPRVQQVYEIICGDNHPPAGEHWDGYVSRLIVDALFSGEPVGEIRPDDQCDDEVWAEIWADLPPGTKLYAEPVQKAQKECSRDAERSEPAKVPSDEVEHLIDIYGYRCEHYGRESAEDARQNLLARYGHPVEPEGWQLVPKELIDFLDAKEHHLPVEDRHVLSIMLDAAPKFGEEP